MVTARRLAKAAGFLVEACAERDSASLATLQAETAPPTILPTDARFAANGAFLPAAEHALTLGTGPQQLDDRSALCWLTALVLACRLAAAALVASGWLHMAEHALVQGALAPLEARRDRGWDA